MRSVFFDCPVKCCVKTLFLFKYLILMVFYFFVKIDPEKT